MNVRRHMKTKLSQELRYDGLEVRHPRLEPETQAHSLAWPKSVSPKMFSLLIDQLLKIVGSLLSLRQHHKLYDGMK